MSDQNNNPHQLKIRKLQERLAGISSGARKDLDVTQREKKYVGNTRETVAPPTVEKKTTEAKQEQSVESILQEIKQQLAQKHQETGPAIETKNEPLEINTTHKVFVQKASKPVEETVVPENKSWRTWVPIPGERLGHLEKKTRSRLLEKR